MAGAHNPLKGYEKIKAQKLLCSIEQGQFDENDVEGLFMKLRAHCGDRRVFREIADFVAHNDIRNKGLTNESMEAFYLSIKYFVEYVSPQRNLNIGEPFPSYIKRLMKYQCLKADGAMLMREFHVSPQSLAKKIESLFKEDKKSQTVVLNGKLGVEAAAAINRVLHVIHVQPAITQRTLIDELLFVLGENKLIFDPMRIEQQSDRITICALALLHGTEYDFNGHRLGRCSISSEQEAISHGVTYVDEHGDEVPNPESFGRLQIHGHVTVQNNGADLAVAYTVFETNLDTTEWCDDSLFVVEHTTASDNHFAWRKLDLSGVIGIDKDFKLIRLAAE